MLYVLLNSFNRYQLFEHLLDADMAPSLWNALQSSPHDD